jgi:hypothetical protein
MHIYNTQCSIHRANKIFLFLLLILVLSWISTESSGSSIGRIHGYTFGQLNKITRERSFNDGILGEVLLGHGGSHTFVSIGNQPFGLVINPWRFCFDEDRYEELEELIGSDVVLEHKRPKSNSLLSCSAADELVDIYPAIEYQPLEVTEVEGSKTTLDPEVSSGIEAGTITNVIKGRNIRSYFLTLQIGNSGDQFRHFIMKDPDIFDFAIENLKMDAKVRLYYIDRLSVSNSTIRSLIWKIEVID